MELKRVLAADTRSAKDKALNLYGADALILSNEKVNGMVEIIVAVDLTQDDLGENIRQCPAVTVPSTATTTALVAPPHFGHVLQSTMQRMQKGQQPAATEETVPPAEQESFRARELVALVRSELEEMRREMRLARLSAQWENTAGLPAHIQALGEIMHETSVPPTLRAILLDEVRHIESADLALAKIRKGLTASLQRTKVASAFSGVHAVTGPSGAGKTSIVYHIANAHSQLHGQDGIAIISFNDNRLGAWPQLQLLSASAGIDCFKIKNTTGLSELVANLSNRKLIIIDTPSNQIEENIGAIRTAASHAACHLVFPADVSAGTIKRFLAVERAHWQSLALTKLDDCLNPWAVIQMLAENDIPLSFAGARSALENKAEVAAIINALVGRGIRLLAPTPLTQTAWAGATLARTFAGAAVR
jgi:flagellar biosynthesis protein FlhF